MSEEVNRKCPPWSMRVQLSSFNPLHRLQAERHNAQRHKQTDRLTDGQHHHANSRSYARAVRSAKIIKKLKNTEEEKSAV